MWFHSQLFVYNFSKKTNPSQKTFKFNYNQSQDMKKLSFCQSRKNVQDYFSLADNLLWKPCKKLINGTSQNTDDDSSFLKLVFSCRDELSQNLVWISQNDSNESKMPIKSSAGYGAKSTWIEHDGMKVIHFSLFVRNVSSMGDNFLHFLLCRVKNWSISSWFHVKSLKLHVSGVN